MKKIALRFLVLFVTLIVVIALAIFLNMGKMRDWAVSKASDASGRKITIADDIGIDWSWPVTSIRLTDVKIANYEQGSEPEMLSADEVLVSVDLKSLLKFDLEFPVVSLDKPILLLEKDEKGNANWNFTDNPGGATATEVVKPDDSTDIPVIGRLLIKDGRMSYRDKNDNTSIEVTAKTIAGTADKGDKLQVAGKGNYSGQPFLMDVTGGTIFQLQDTDKPYPVDIKFEVGKTKVVVTGTMTDPVQLKGLDLQLALKGENAAELFDVAGIALPPTPPYNVKGKLTYEEDVWKFTNFKGNMGGSDLGGSVKWDTRKERPLLSGEFISQKLDFADLGGLVGSDEAVGQSEGASEAQKNNAAAAAADPYVIPETPLDISRLSAMDAKVTFTGRKLVSSSLPLDDFFMEVDLDDSLLKIKPVRFGTASGDIKAYLTVNARQEPVRIDSDFRFRRLALKPMFEKLAQTLNQPNLAEGYIGGTAKLAGYGKSLREMLGNSNGNIGIGMEGGQFSNLLIELLGLDVAQGIGLFIGGDKPVPIHCVIGNFGVKDGLMQVRQFIIDTEDSNIQGDGNINLKNEAMNLELKTYPKDNTLITLNSPIRIGGTLKNPDVNINLRNIAARSAVAVAASLIAFPAAVLAFVERGLGEDSPCTALIQKMNKDSGSSNNKNMIPKNK